MDFISTGDFNEAEKVFWSALKEAFENGAEGYCWHRFPITSTQGPRFEPDVVILHREWGLHVIEVKGCFIRHIEAIEGPIWYMKDWYEDEAHPVQQVEKHMWAIVDRLKEFQYNLLRESTGDCKISHRAYVALPFINEQEWQERFAGHISAPTWQAIFSTHLVRIPRQSCHRFQVNPATNSTATLPPVLHERCH